MQKNSYNKEVEYEFLSFILSIESIKNKILSIFGAGHWFLNEASPKSDIDIIVIVEDYVLLESHIEQKIQNSIHSKTGLPLSIRFFNKNCFLGYGIEENPILSNINTLKIFLKHFEYYKLLYGIPFNKYEKIGTADKRENFLYWKNLINNLPSYDFLKNNSNKYFQFHDFIKIYLFAKMAKAEYFENYIFDYSFNSIKKFYVSNPLIKNTFKYRNCNSDISIESINIFYKEVIKDINEQSNELVSTIICPFRKVIAKRYGTIQMPIFVGKGANDYVNFLYNILPSQICKELDRGNKYLIILGNIEGVMDIYNRENQNETEESIWLHFNNVKQTLHLISLGLKNKSMNIDNVETNSFERILNLNDNVFFVSLSDLLLGKSITVNFPNKIQSSKTVSEITDYFKQNIEEKDTTALKQSFNELKEKCPNLSDAEINEQNLKIRYGLRKAVGVFIDSVSKYLSCKSFVIYSAFEPEIIDIFHQDISGKKICTKYDLKLISFNLSENSFLSIISDCISHLTTVSRLRLSVRNSINKSLNFHNELKYRINEEENYTF